MKKDGAVSGLFLTSFANSITGLVGVERTYMENASTFNTEIFGCFLVVPDQTE